MLAAYRSTFTTAKLDTGISEIENAAIACCSPKRVSGAKQFIWLRLPSAYMSSVEELGASPAILTLA